MLSVQLIDKKTAVAKAEKCTRTTWASFSGLEEPFKFEFAEDMTLDEAVSLEF